MARKNRRPARVVSAGLLVVLVGGGAAAVRAQDQPGLAAEISRLLAGLEADGLAPEVTAVVAASPAPRGELLALLAAVPLPDGEEEEATCEFAALVGQVRQGRLVLPDPAARPLQAQAHLERWVKRAVGPARRALDARGPAVVADERGGLAELPDGLQVALRAAADALDTEAGLAAEAGRADAAWAAVADLARLVDRVRWPTMAGRVMVDAWRSRLIERVALTLARCGPPAHPADLAATLERLEDVEGLALACRGELARNLSISRRLTDGGLAAAPELGVQDTGQRLDRTALLRDQAALLRIHGPVLRAAAAGRLDELLVIARSAAYELRRSRAEPLPVTQVLGSGTDRFVERTLVTVAALRMARAALALGATRGELPGALPRDAALTDPFASPPAPLRWRRTGPRSGLLWSVGPQGQDDGRDLGGPDDESAPEWARRVVRLEVRLP